MYFLHCFFYDLAVFIAICTNVDVNFYLQNLLHIILCKNITQFAANAANTTVVSPVVGLAVGAVVVVLSVACFFLFYNDKSYYSYYNSCSNSNDNYDQGRVA